MTRVLRAVGGCGAGPGRRLRFCGAARRTAGGVPHPGPTLLFNLKRCFAPLTCASDPGPLERLGWILREAASSRYITGSEVRPVQCTHTTTSRACLRVGRPARLDLLVAAGWNQAPAGPAREWSMQAVMGPLAPLSHPTGSSGWYGRQGAARRSWVRGLVSVHPPRWLPRPPPAAHTAASGAQRHFHHPDDGEDRCSRRCLSRRSG